MSIRDINQRAMLARLSVSQWSARKLDRKATRQVTAENGANADAARVNKHLLAGQDEPLKAIQAEANAARAEFYAMTLPWSDDGPRILSADLWPDLNRKLQTRALTFAALVDAFVAEYAQARERAQFALGDLFNANDYPPAWQVRAKFSLSFDYDPLPDATDFRVDLADADAEAIRADIEQRSRARYAEAMRDVWQRLYSAVERIAVTLPKVESGEQSKFHDTLTGNLVDLLAILPGLNIAADPELDRIAERARAELAGFAPQTLRESPDARQQAASSAAAICRTMAAAMGMPSPELPAMPEPFATPRPAAAVIDLFAPPVRAA